MPQGTFRIGLRLRNGGFHVVSWLDHIKNKLTSSGSLLVNEPGSVTSHTIGLECLFSKLPGFFYPRQHFGLVDNDCVPVTLFEMPDLIALATNQMQWTDLVGIASDDPKHTRPPTIVTEAHLEYNAGLVVSFGSQCRPSPITQHSTAEMLADELADYRSQLLAMARPPENPTGPPSREPCLPH